MGRISSQLGLVITLGIALLSTPAPSRAQTQAPTRRAVLVGINHYQIHPSGDRVGDLDGAVADAEAMASLLQTLHGFRAENVKILRNQEASRAAILSAIETHLEKSVQPGDLSVFYYAGHGSYVENPNSAENDKLDETIVPADSNLGAADIRDKELALRFHHILDRKAQLVAIIDSCHSGSIARGFPEQVKNRSVPPAPAALSSRGEENRANQGVEERGALIWSAAQDHQAAQERRIRGQPRGRFTSAVEYVLASAHRDESAEKLHLRVRALMQSGGSLQEPELNASHERRTRALWGQPPSSALPGDGPSVAVSRMSGTHVYLQAGIASGIGVDAVLRKYREPQGPRLRVVEVSGMATSVAELQAGSSGNISPGDLFTIENYGIPYGEGLKIYIPAILPSAAELARAVTRWSALATDQNIHFVTDPTESTPTHVISWEGGAWQLHDASGAGRNLGAQPDVRVVHKYLLGISQPRLFLNIPLAKESAAQLSKSLSSSGSFIQLVDDAASATYHLVGRIASLSKDPSIQYALVLPGAQRDDSHSTLPSRSDWIEPHDNRFMGRLVLAARRLNKVLLWHTIDSPPADDTFPYQLAIVDLENHRVLPDAEPLRVGRKYQLAMVAERIGPRPRPRYVYIFSLDREGSCSLMVPSAESSNGENYVPDARSGGPAPKQVAIGCGFSVAPPLGRDTLVMITTVTPIATPSAFCIDNEERSASTSGSDSLTRFLFGLGRDIRTQSSIPTGWSLQRLTVDSVEK